MNTLGAVSRVGRLSLPTIVGGGDEFHLFAIAVTRGGNATADLEYWAVVVRTDEVWSSSLPDGQLTVGRVDAGELVLEQPATTTEPGTRSRIAFGLAKSETLPVLPSRIVHEQTRILVGTLSGGFHATSWRPIFETGSETLTIDEDGPCRLPEVGDEGYPARMTAEISTFSDGRRVIRCSSLARQGKMVDPTP